MILRAITRATLPLPHAVREVNNGKSIAKPLPHPMMEGEFLVEAKEYKLPAIRCMLCVALWIWSAILPWIPLVSVPVVLAFILAALHFARYKKEPKWLLRNIEWLRTFYVWLGALAILGGTWAFFLPIAINSGFNKNDDGPVLRQLIIYTTGGLLGAITLGETRRKNDQEHMRQVHAERHSRYAKAIEQLADEKAPIRLGGVYTLAKLVDEWLADEKTLPSEEERHQEGQIIIDSLCAYIRSSFPLAERHDELTLSYEEYQQNRQGNQDLRSSQAIPLPKPKNTKQSREEFIRDKSLFQEEQEVRKKILSEIKNRLNGGTTKNKDGRDEIKPGTWSYFEYDFSNAVFFYDVKFNKVNFSGKKTSFSATKFIRKANFSGATFHETHKATNFSGTTFHETHKVTNFSGAHFHKEADFSETIFSNQVHFFDVEFIEGTNFFKATFTKSAFFSKTKFMRSAYFFLANFIEGATFSEVIFNGTAYFHGATFNRGAYFFMANFQFEPIFESAFDDKTYKAKFSNWVDPEDYNLYGSDINLEDFFVDPDSPYKIEIEKHRSPDGTITTIPKGCIVFDSKTGEEVPHTPAPNGSV